MVVLTWWVVMPNKFAVILTVMAFFVIFHIITTFSAISRVIMLTSAMSSTRIMQREEEEKMTPEQLSDALISRARLAKTLDVSIAKQYRIDCHELMRDVEEGRVSLPMDESERRASRMIAQRERSREQTTLASKMIQHSTDLGLPDLDYMSPQLSGLSGELSGVQESEHEQSENDHSALALSTLSGVQESEKGESSEFGTNHDEIFRGNHDEKSHEL